MKSQFELDRQEREFLSAMMYLVSEGYKLPSDMDGKAQAIAKSIWEKLQ